MKEPSLFEEDYRKPPKISADRLVREIGGGHYDYQQMVIDAEYFADIGDEEKREILKLIANHGSDKLRANLVWFCEGMLDG